MNYMFEILLAEYVAFDQVHSKTWTSWIFQGKSFCLLYSKCVILETVIYMHIHFVGYPYIVFTEKCKCVI